jgi:hypothetical protein
MLLQEAFHRALDERARDQHARPVDPRILAMLQGARQDDDSGQESPVPDAQLAKLVYRARKLAHRWCQYARPHHDSSALLGGLRDEWVVFARQISALPHQQRVLVLWEMASAMRPEQIRHDAERFRYLSAQAAVRPDAFEGLMASPRIPWPGPASFFIHAIAELEDASDMERSTLHRFIEDHWSDEPLWLLHALAWWVAQHTAPAWPAPAR